MPRSQVTLTPVRVPLDRSALNEWRRLQPASERPSTTQGGMLVSLERPGWLQGRQFVKSSCSRGWPHHPGYNGTDGNRSETTNDSEVKEMIIGVRNCQFTQVYSAVTEILPIEPTMPRSLASSRRQLLPRKLLTLDSHQLCSAQKLAISESSGRDVNLFSLNSMELALLGRSFVMSV